MVQVIEKHSGKFRMVINDIKCTFIPMSLFREDKFLPIEPKVKGSTLGWNIGGKFVSYNQIKKHLKTNQ